jgi:alkylation response protein AidB-like acyl-CoA dehydrogenase
MLTERRIYDSEHTQFRDSVKRFIAREVTPKFASWEANGIVDRQFWRKGGEAGVLCPQVPEQYGGPNGTFLHNAIVVEEMSYAGYAGPATDFSVHSDVCAGYILSYGTETQKSQWLAAMAAGKSVCAVAMSEPDTGSDLQAIKTRAVRDGDQYIISGQKTFISNGQLADLVIVVARTDAAAGSRGISLIVVETSRTGFRRGRNLDKLGQISADTSEIFFDAVRVPVSNLLGSEGGGFAALMTELPQERLTLAVASMAAAQRAHDITCSYVRERKAFGKKIMEFQNTKFKLADLKADLAVGWAFVDQCLEQHIRGELSNEGASIAKLWCSEMQGKLVDQCLQFFGGYGFMREYEICRLYADARVQRIYGGTSEIMRELISRSL